MTSYHQPELETLSRSALTDLQSQRLCAALRRVYENVPAYRQKCQQAGVTPADIRGIEDLSKLPFTVKQDFRDNYPYGLFAVPLSDIVRLHASSGTTGKQTVVGYTANDLQNWGHIMARALAAAGLDRTDVGHISYGYGLFTGGLGAHLGSETLGCATIPASTGNTRRQVTLLQDLRPTFLLCTPSYALTIAEYLEEHHIDPDSLALKAGIFGAEPWTEQMRREIERRLHLEAFDIYGLSEAMGPGVAFECKEHQGLHVNEDHFIVEIIDPDTGAPLPDGEQGEIVFTCITKEALPLIRYRTRDIGCILPGECACGRTFRRLAKPAGRTDDMLIIRGVNVFPSQVEAALTGLPGVTPFYQLIVEREGNLDRLTVLIEINQDNLTDEVRKLQEINRMAKAAIESTIGVAVTVKLVEPKRIQRFEGKAVRVIDRRKDIAF